VFLIEVNEIVDDRGVFARAWCVDEFARQGLDSDVLQINLGFSHRRGTLRGMHFQRPPHAEAKYVRCTRGAVFDVAVDVRAGSPTCGRWVGFELSACNRRGLYVPPGYAHGYQTLSDESEILYTTSARYAAASATGVRYDDAAFGIRWPGPVSVISHADSHWPDFEPEEWK
jgi:dTDP-4-dehydrorhamnose 3,5-epimerase